MIHCQEHDRARSAAAYHRHRERYLASTRAWEKANPERRERNRLRAKLRRYGLTIETYDAMLAAQGGRCAVCRAAEPGGRGAFHVDHDHRCCPGKSSCGRCVRGLVCTTCNSAMGHAKDDPALLRAMADYIEIHAG